MRLLSNRRHTLIPPALCANRDFIDIAKRDHLLLRSVALSNQMRQHTVECSHPVYQAVLGGLLKVTKLATGASFIIRADECSSAVLRGINNGTLYVTKVGTVPSND